MSVVDTGPVRTRRLAQLGAALLGVGVVACGIRWWAAVVATGRAVASTSSDYWPPALGGLGLVLLMIAWLGRDHRETATRPIRPISAAVVTAVVALTVGAGALSTVLLLREADGAPQAGRATLRIDAIKTGLTVALGTGGGAALFLALRRQWLSERMHSHAEEDTVRRRVTELYSAAVGQLGDDSPAVRLGSVYALERLAQQNSDQRQTVVDVLCAYLCMPVTDDEPDPPDSPRLEAQQGTWVRPTATENGERQVRLAIQTLLRKHAAPSPAPSGRDTTHWENLRLNLAGAVLHDFTMNGCSLLAVDLSNARLLGTTDFHGARVHSDAWFLGCRFRGDAEFSSIRFAGDTRFSGADFGGDANFGGATFAHEARFDRGTVFAQRANFVGTTFDGGAWFMRAEFRGDTAFASSTFRQVGHFESTIIDRTEQLNGVPPGWTIGHGADGRYTLERAAS